MIRIGKCWVIAIPKRCDPIVRLEKFRIANLDELDDFIYVWETFELDDLMTEMGKPRIWSAEKYWFKDPCIWDLYIKRLALDYKKRVARNPYFHDRMTTLMEFARGGENTIGNALSLLSDKNNSEAQNL